MRHLGSWNMSLAFLFSFALPLSAQAICLPSVDPENISPQICPGLDANILNETQTITKTAVNQVTIRSSIVSETATTYTIYKNPEALPQLKGFLKKLLESEEVQTNPRHCAQYNSLLNTVCLSKQPLFSYFISASGNLSTRFDWDQKAEIRLRGSPDLSMSYFGGVNSLLPPDFSCRKDRIALTITPSGCGIVHFCRPGYTTMADGTVVVNYNPGFGRFRGACSAFSDGQAIQADYNYLMSPELKQANVLPASSNCTQGNTMCLTPYAKVPLLQQNSADLMRLLSLKTRITNPVDVGFCSPTVMAMSLIGLKYQSQGSLGSFMDAGKYFHDPRDNVKSTNWAAAIFRSGQLLGTDWWQGGSASIDHERASLQDLGLGNSVGPLSKFTTKPYSTEAYLDLINQKSAIGSIRVGSYLPGVPDNSYHALSILGQINGMLRIYDPWGRIYLVKVGSEIGTTGYLQVNPNRSYYDQLNNLTRFGAGYSGYLYGFALVGKIAAGAKFPLHWLRYAYPDAYVAFIGPDRSFSEVGEGSEKHHTLIHLQGENGFVYVSGNHTAKTYPGWESIIINPGPGDYFSAQKAKNYIDVLYGVGQRIKGVYAQALLRPPTESEFTKALEFVNDSTEGLKSLTTQLPMSPNFNQAQVFGGNDRVDLVSLGTKTGTPSITGYPRELFAKVGVAFQSPAPKTLAVADIFRVSPDLPHGLYLDEKTGIISGKINQAFPIRTYRLIASNGSGSGAADFQLGGVTQFPPRQMQIEYRGLKITSNLNYPESEANFRGYFLAQLNAPMAPIVYRSHQGDPCSFGITQSTTAPGTPWLPAGLNFDKATGTISGTPTQLGRWEPWLTCQNAGGSAYVGLKIQIVDSPPQPPTSLSYGFSERVFYSGETYSPVTPTLGGGQGTQYWVQPLFPGGVYLNSISGSLTVPSYFLIPQPVGFKSYTVYGANGWGVAPPANLNLYFSDNPPVSIQYGAANRITYRLGDPPDLPWPTVVSKTANRPTNTVGSITSITPVNATNLVNISFYGNIAINRTALDEYLKTTTLPLVLTLGVRLANSAGAATATVAIDILPQIPPLSLSYDLSKTKFTVNTAFGSVNPTWTGGRPGNYRSDPQVLPPGLALHNVLGTISGTPTADFPETKYKIFGSNSAGTASTEILLGSPRVRFRYNPILTFVAGLPSSYKPTVELGTISNFSTTQTLPLGLTLNSTTGEISGVAQVLSPSAAFTVNATGSLFPGSTSFQLQVVPDLPILNLSYANVPSSLSLGAPITLTPSYSQGRVFQWLISPSLPYGMSFDLSTGVISGSPSEFKDQTTYTITAKNAVDTKTTTISFLTTSSVKPDGITFKSEGSSTSLTEIATTVGAYIDVKPSLSVGWAKTWSVSPVLPSGLSFTSMTGQIYGRPTLEMPRTIYTVSATGPGGTSSISLPMSVGPSLVPTRLSYSYISGTTVNISGPQVLIAGEAIPVWRSFVAPTSAGCTFALDKNPPYGMFFSLSSGHMTGTPSALSSNQIYKVTATCPQGKVSTDLEIGVVAPNPIQSISYTLPKSVFTTDDVVSVLPQVSGGKPNRFTISPALPSGLYIDSATGRLAGKATSTSASKTYTITASNFSSPGVTTTVTFSVDRPPVAFNFGLPKFFNGGL